MSVPNAEWMPAGACRGEDARLFFSPGEKEGRDERALREHAAKEICKQCLVQNDCLNYALRNRERQGIWGGTTETERIALWR